MRRLTPIGPCVTFWPRPPQPLAPKIKHRPLLVSGLSYLGKRPLGPPIRNRMVIGTLTPFAFVGSHCVFLSCQMPRVGLDVR